MGAVLVFLNPLWKMHAKLHHNGASQPEQFPQKLACIPLMMSLQRGTIRVDFNITIMMPITHIEYLHK